MSSPRLTISAVIPTRGDVSLGPIIDRLQEFPEIDEVMIVTGNTPFNRYLAAERAKNFVIYTQDDDYVTDLRPLIEAYSEESRTIVNAMTPEHAAQYPTAQTLIGFGCLFSRLLASTSFLRFPERDALFLRESDRIFGTVNPHFTVFPRIQQLPHATASNRLYRQPDHVAMRMAMEQRIFERTGIRA